MSLNQIQSLEKRKNNVKNNIDKNNTLLQTKREEKYEVMIKIIFVKDFILYKKKFEKSYIKKITGKKLMWACSLSFILGYLITGPVANVIILKTLISLGVIIVAANILYLVDYLPKLKKQINLDYNNKIKYGIETINKSLLKKLTASEVEIREDIFQLESLIETDNKYIINVEKEINQIKVSLPAINNGYSTLKWMKKNMEQESIQVKQEKIV